MDVEILPFLERVTLLGGGECKRATLEEMLTLAPRLVAADGAAGRALDLGRVPEWVVGDMDSLSDAARAALPAGRILRIDEQDSTDFDKALRRIEAPLILGVGFMGARLDHELACYNSLVRRAERRCILVGEHDICFHLSDPVDLPLVPGTRLSLFPMAAVVANGTGLVWPVEDLALAPWGRIGTSNTVDAGGLVHLQADSPGLLVILPRAALPGAIAALDGQAKPGKRSRP